MTALRHRFTGLLALLVILAIIVGLPTALLAVGANPLGSGLPSLTSIKDALTAPDDGRLALGLIKVIGWVSWAFLTFSLLVELFARVRGVQAPTLPGLRMPQNAARGLVTAALVLFVANPAATGAVNAAALHSAAATSSSSAPAATTTSSTADRPAPSTSQAAERAASHHAPVRQTDTQRTVQHTVKRGETLWSIAQTQLSDGRRFREIVELNPELLHGKADFIRAGWVLDIPSPATGDTVVIEQGDTLSEIALEELGDANRYPEIFKASRAITQPGGARLTDPDMIDVGWRVQLPGASTADTPGVRPPTPSPEPAGDQPSPHGSSGTRQQPSTPHGHTGDQGGTGSGTASPGATRPDATSPGASGQPRPSTPAPRAAPSTDATAPTAAVPTGSANPDAASRVATEDHLDEDADWVVRTGFGVGALLAAGVLTLIGTRRRTQQRRRHPGQRLPMPTGPTAQVEHQLRTTADTLSVEVVDVALRCLAWDCARTSTPVPVVRAARLTATQFDLYLAEPAELPTPWTGTADTTVWTLEVDHTTYLADVDVTDVPAPYPALVTIGHDEDDGHVFLDLEHLGALSVTGESLATREVLAALAVELATSTWAEDLQVSVVGAFAELEDTLQTGRIRYLPSAGRVLDDLAVRAAQDHQALATAGFTDVHTARTAGAVPDAWSPEIVLMAGDITDRQRNQLQQLLGDLPGVAVAVVTATVSVGEWGLDLTAGDTPDLAVLTPIDLQLRPQRLPAEQYGHLLQLAALSDVDELDGLNGLDVRDSHPEPTLAEVEAVAPVDEADVAPTAPGVLTAPELSLEALEAVSHDRQPPHTEVESADHAEVAVAPAAGELGTKSGATAGMFLPDSARITTDAASAGDETDRETLQQEPQSVADPAGDAAPHAGSGGTVPNTARLDEAATPEAAEQSAATNAPRILVLGPVDIVNATGQVEPSKRARLLEYAAYLALHPGATHTQIDDAIWPHRTNEDNLTTRNPATSKLRRWIGSDPKGHEYLPRHQAGEGYAFSLAVTTDVRDWDALLGGDPLNAPTENLEAALQLVRGVPFEGTHRKRYAWAEPLKQRLNSEIVDASYELARRRLMEGRWRAAEQAVTVGLRVEPGLEHLWRLRILAVHESRNPDAEAQAIERLLAFIDLDDGDLEPETEQLLTALKTPGVRLDQFMANAP